MKNKTKRITAIILAVMLLFGSLSLTAFAIEYEGKCGDSMSWSLNADGVLEITGSGAMYEYESAYDIPWAEYTENVTKVVIADGITSVSDYAFYGCGNLKDAYLPPSLTALSGAMFYLCGFESFDIPDTVEVIGRYAFGECYSLKTVTIPYGVKEIRGYAFLNSSIESVIIPGSVKRIGGYVSEETGEIEEIAPFQYCPNLETVVLEEGVEEIGDGAFSDCETLSNIVIPNSVTSIGAAVFVGCQKLESIVIPSGVKSFGQFCFIHCGIKDIYYKGTQKQWAEIEIAENNSQLDDITVHCTAEKVSSNGIKIEYDSAYFENNDEIVAKAEEKSVFDSNFSEYDEDADAIKHYDIHLEYSNGTIAKSENTETEFTVKIPVPAGYEHYTEFLIKHRMTHEDGSKSVERIYGKVDGGYIVFKTKSFSDFIICDFGFESDSVSLNYKSSATVFATKGDVEVIYTSSNPDVATVDENGNVTTHGRGTAIITATLTTDDGETITDTCTITVDFTIIQWIIRILLLGFLWY